MHIVRTPLRVSLFGGGTDHESYFREHGSTIISFAITRYMYITWNERPTGGCRLSYSKVEELDSLTQAEHTIVRAAADTYSIQEPCTLTIVSDLPKGTGLGSSSALAVGLCGLTNATFQGGKTLPEMAYDLEHSVSPQVGFQDHLPAAWGGLQIYHMPSDEQAKGPKGSPQSPKGYLSSFRLRHAEELINSYGMLLYTGQSRQANRVLPNWRKSEDALHDIHSLADRAATLAPNWTLSILGSLLAETWALKRSIPGVCDQSLVDQYESAITAGAQAGKLCGAGGGGCWFFLVEPRLRRKVKEALNLIEIPFSVDTEGCRKWEL